jgi:hypothetical protein
MLRDGEMSRTSDSRKTVRGARHSIAARAPVVLAQFSTRLPPELLERLRTAAPQLGLRQSEITTAALQAFLTREGF